MATGCAGLQAFVARDEAMLNDERHTWSTWIMQIDAV